jgi:hypothetical protein
VAPFQAASGGELCVQILNAPVVPLRQLRPDLPPSLAAVVHRCMQRPVEARFANIADLAEALAPHAHSSAAEVASRIRRRMSSRATTVIATKPVPAGSLELESHEAVESIAVSGFPAVLLARPGRRIGRGRYARPLALGAAVAFVSFFMAVMFQGEFARSRAFVTLASARVAAAALALVGREAASTDPTSP